MTTSVSTSSNSQIHISVIQDRFEITDLIYRLGACLDEHRFEDLRDLFIEDATASTPGGIAQGRDAVIAQATRNHLKYARLQHSMTNLLIDLNGDHASVRCQSPGHLRRRDGSPRTRAWGGLPFSGATDRPGLEACGTRGHSDLATDVRLTRISEQTSRRASLFLWKVIFRSA